MIITYIHRIGWFIGLVLLQVLILNNVHIAGYATPFLYIYFILKFNSGTSRNELMLWAFFFGLTIDVFSIEFFSFSGIWLLLLRVALCTVLTVTCIVAVEGIRR